jgi:hypothetical protein
VWIVPELSQRLADQFRKILVQLEFHDPSRWNWYYPLACQVGCVGKCRWDVLGPQPWQLDQNFLCCGTVSQVVQDHCDGNPGACKADYSMQDVRVSGDVRLPIHGDLNKNEKSFYARAVGHALEAPTSLDYDA